ncbi:MAG: CpsD/CapB family tyrosine-protein kinase [Oscillospiraceae bacterium]|nr:CpsD/CapB family tyrosine-protein kinase [Oscillospiraceae bacterium]
MKKIEIKRFVANEFHAIEALKTLRTNLMFSGPDNTAIALTSYSATEGKSTIAFQLAASLAQADKRVLLLDADLRRSSLSSRLRVKGKVDGLSHYLSGMANVNDLLYETDMPGMYIMFAGVLVPSAAELLGSQGLVKLIPALKETFDYVIIDTPPLGQVIDCAIMAPILDGVLFVIDSTNNSYKLQRRMKASLEKSGGKVLGVILNCVDFTDRHSYYGKSRSYYGKDLDEK